MSQYMEQYNLYCKMHLNSSKHSYVLYVPYEGYLNRIGSIEGFSAFTKTQTMLWDKQTVQAHPVSRLPSG